MTDETKKLFDAPWHVARVSTVETEEGIEIASLSSSTDAKRIASLPEIYDYLVCASFEYCKGCTKSFSSPDSFLSAGCAGKDGFCPAVFWWETLRKVRDGE
jgi:hypothetical protein